MATTFDTLEFAERLKAGGFTEQQARAATEAFAKATSQELATKADLDGLARTTRSDLEEFRRATRADLEEFRRVTKTDIDELRRSTEADFDALRRDVKADIDELRRSTKSDFDLLRKDVEAYYWKVLAGVAAMLLVNLGVVWGIVATYAVKGR